MALEAAEQGRTGRVRYRGMKGVEAVAERQQRVLVEGDDDRSSPIEGTVDFASFGPVFRSETQPRLAPPQIARQGCAIKSRGIHPNAVGARPQKLRSITEVSMIKNVMLNLNSGLHDF